MAHSKNSPQRVQGRLRELEAVRLRIRGLHYDEIGAELGVSESGARKIVRRAMDRNRELLQETVKEHVELDLARIEALIKGLWPKADGGNLRAVDRIERLLARKAKLLGLDAPTKLKVGGDPDQGPILVTWPEDKQRT